MILPTRWHSVVGSLALTWAAESWAFAAPPTVEQALGLAPVQKEVSYDRPEAAVAAKCTLTAEKIGDQTGWIVRDAAGQTLRRFADTNGDNVVDEWSYFEDGLEVYRDIDSNHNGRADQHRWMNTAGRRWAMDEDEDGKIDRWKTISAEEASAEVIQALVQQDARRFSRLLLTQTELETLGLGEARAKDVAAKIAAAEEAFKVLMTSQKKLAAKSNWVHFGGNRPGLVPSGTESSTKDLLVYENVLAMVETDGKHDQVPIGTLIQVGDAWRLIDAPRLPTEGQADAADVGFFFRSPASRPDATGATAPTNESKLQELLAKLEASDKAAASSTSPADQARQNADRAALLEQIAELAPTPVDRGQWIRQLADFLSAAVQSGEFADGTARLKALQEKMVAAGDEDLGAYVEFRYMTARYSLDLQAPKPDFVKIQSEWLQNLENYVNAHPKSADASEALLQLAIAKEFAGQEDEAKKWYAQLVKSFPQSSATKKAEGAITRIDSVGKTIRLQGPAATGGTVDLAKYRGKAVLIHYWAATSEPCRADLVQLNNLLAKHAKAGLAIIGVSLDANKQDLVGFLQKTRLSWPQIFEPGGLDNRLANEMGILSLPTMILIDKQGRVANRNIHVGEVEGELEKILR